MKARFINGVRKVQLLSPLEEQRIAAEAAALDAVHIALAAAPPGLTARELADRTGLGLGYVQKLLASSTAVLKRRTRRPHKWWADWSDLDGWRRRIGRPRLHPAQKPGTNGAR